MIEFYDQLTNREEYNGEIISVLSVKWGQLKLFLSELSFLSKMKAESNKKFKILYIGAADGYHTGLLADMFPDYTFDLWDPRDFSIKEEDHKNIKIFQKYFTDEETENYKKKNKDILIICDIRTLSIKFAKSEEDLKRRINKMDEIINEDLNFQKNWVIKINPYASLLKFRLPYNSGKTEYFDAKIYLQHFGPKSTETRMLVKNIDNFTLYDNVEYDEKMAYYNNHIRPLPVEDYEPILKKLNLINNIDSASLVKLSTEYLMAMNKASDDDNVINLVNKILNYHKRFNNKYYQQMLRN